MKKGKAVGPSGVVLEMILASEQHTIPHLTKLANSIFEEGKFTEDWNLSHIINYFKGKGNLLAIGNYCGLKLLDHVMKIIECVMKSVTGSSFNINKMQCVLMPGRGAMDSIFILQQMHEKHLGKHKPLYFAFVDLGNAF